MSTPVSSSEPRPGIFKDVTFYHWLVVIIASAGWLFDCMDQRLFTVAKESALKELLGSDAAAQAALSKYLNYAVAAMMIGWGTGGLLFGMLSDKWGRVKTMVATLLVYSSFTGLSGFAQTWIDFTLYRFLVGLGVGGMFGAATTLVAESVPGGFRSLALGSLQALSATGNITGTIISMKIQPGAENVALGDLLGIASSSGWRLLFFVGILPALLVVPIVFFLREPEAWRNAKAEAKAGKSMGCVGSPLALFRHPRWRKNTFVGLGLGVSGMVGLWGIGFFSPELVTSALQHSPLRESDLTRPSQIVAMTRDVSLTAAQFIRQRFSPEIQTRLAQATDPNASLSDLVPALTADFNRIIEGPSLYESNAFRSIPLKKNTINLLGKVEQAGTPADVAFLNRQLLEQAFPGAIASIQSYIDGVRSRGLLLQDVGSLTGMMVFTMVASYFNRRKAFAGAFVLCLLTTAYVFNSLRTETDVYWMLPMMGFAQLAVFAGYSIYFPELYPTRLRGTGVGFCYNVVRFLTVPFNLLMAWMSTWMPFRSAAIILSMVYLIGLVSLIWAPETKDQPLPED
ncbi:MAG TPA: MFS transporter [Candidatus Paceibacterota bacterium]|nr:MFS transporter [Verrucomicrobiota bacterium]HRY47235.1 MFS transporter [Candidatus Paceibacterota bacterium]HSA02082.1 MFS transporter [Candidatus Paceibacterota bacterium]